MLYCNRCGQCRHINEDNFIGWARVTGTEKQYLDPETGDINDTDGMDDTEYGDIDYECPHCQSSSIEFDYNCEPEEAFNQRASYERDRTTRQKEILAAALRDKIKDSDWDLATNEVHK